MPTQEERDRMNEIIAESVEKTNECIQNLRNKLDELNKQLGKLYKQEESNNITKVKEMLLETKNRVEKENYELTKGE